jgi:hypothetical protein
MKEHNAALEGAVVVCGLSALGAAFYSIGIPQDSIMQYESALKSDKFIVLAHGTVGQVEQAMSILKVSGATHVDAHQGA